MTLAKIDSRLPRTYEHLLGVCTPNSAVPGTGIVHQFFFFNISS